MISANNLKIALCAIAKNENLYIREWVQWYKNIGIDHIFLYDNNEIDGEHFEEVILDYINEGFVEIINKRGVEKGCVYDDKGINLQPKCYIECYTNLCKDYDWICFFDIDEFLNIKRNGVTIKKILAKHIFDNIDTVLVSWEHYDDNDFLYYSSTDVTKRFTRRSNYARYGLKSIVRCGKMINDPAQPNLIHIFRCVGKKMAFIDGTSFTANVNWYTVKNEKHNSFDVVLNHYKTKTASEYIRRHLGRHWGTGKKLTNNAKSALACFNDFAKYNNISKEKLDVFFMQDLIINNMHTNEIKKSLIALGKAKGLELNLNTPRTIQDKINWLKIYDCSELKGRCADKIKVHDYVREKLGKDICVPIIKIYDSPDDININELPEKFVLKCNHGYAMNIICRDKTTFDEENAKQLCKKWINIDFGLDSPGYQYHYHFIDRKCYVETLLEDGIQKNSLFDYKFWCFNGKPILYTINEGNGHGDIMYYNIKTGQCMDLYNAFNNNIPKNFKKPVNFKEMLNYAQILAKDFTFVRIDFYEINGKVYLGEMTFTPGNGMFKYKKTGADVEIGNMLTLPFDKFNSKTAEKNTAYNYSGKLKRVSYVSSPSHVSFISNKNNAKPGIKTTKIRPIIRTQ